MFKFRNKIPMAVVALLFCNLASPVYADWVISFQGTVTSTTQFNNTAELASVGDSLNIELSLPHYFDLHDANKDPETAYFSFFKSTGTMNSADIEFESFFPIQPSTVVAWSNSTETAMNLFNFDRRKFSYLQLRGPTIPTDNVFDLLDALNSFTVVRTDAGNYGDIEVTGTIDSVSYYKIAPVPLPAAAWLFASAFIGLFWKKRSA